MNVLELGRLGRKRAMKKFQDSAKSAAQAGDWHQALDFVLRALDCQRNDAAVWALYGRVLTRLGRTDRAVAAFRTATEIKPGEVTYHLDYAVALRRTGAFAEAKKAYFRAFALAPDTAAAFPELDAFAGGEEELAEIRRDMAGRSRRRAGRVTWADRARDAAHWGLAARLYREALRRNPQRGPIWIQYGHVLKEAGNLDDAEAAYRRAISCNPKEADSYLHLGHVLKMQGRVFDASAAYMRAQILNPEWSEPSEELRRLGWKDDALAQLKAGRFDHTRNSAFPNPGSDASYGALLPLSSSQMVGSLDGVFGTTAAGWVWNPAAPETRAEVEFVVDGAVICRVQAKRFRSDIKEAGFGSGYSGFEVELPLELPEAGIEVHARLAGTELALNNSPQIASEPTGIAKWKQRKLRVVGEFKAKLCARLDRETSRKLSIVMPIYNTRPDWLRAAIESVIDQWCGRWELICVNNGSTDAAVRPVLDKYRRMDQRIKVVTRDRNAGIAAGVNAGIARATGDLITWMDSDDYLEPDAVYKVLRTYQVTGADLIYSDEAVTTENIDAIRAVAARPAYSWDYYLSHPYFVHLVCVSQALMTQVGGWNELARVSGDVDFVLRCQEVASAVAHIPAVLYRWRTHLASDGHSVRERVTPATTGALNRHLARTFPGAVASAGPEFNFYRVDFPDDHGEVLAVIPTKNRADLLKPCLDSLFATTRASELRILVVDHESDDPDIREYLESIESKVTILPYKGVFNYARINNTAVKWYRSKNGCLPPYLAFLNNDVEAIESGWLEHMRGLAARSDVGIVGATLLYPDDTIQHSGVIIGLNGAADHAHKFTPFLTGELRTQGPLGSLLCTREYSAVTAACMISRTAIFLEVGGFDEQLAVGFNDTDYCLRVGAKGYKVLNDAYAVLRHYESASRLKSGGVKHPKDDAFFKRRWQQLIADGDPFYSPLFGLKGPDHRANKCSDASGLFRVRPGLKGRMDMAREIPIESRRLDVQAAQ